MTKYFFYSLTSIAYLYYTFATSHGVFRNGIVLPNILDIIACLLFAIAAGLFLFKKDRLAGITSLISLGMTSRIILENWYFVGRLMSTYNAVILIVFVSLSTLFLLFLFIVSIKSVILNDHKLSEIPIYYPNERWLKALSILPSLIVIVGTVVVWTFISIQEP